MSSAKNPSRSGNQDDPWEQLAEDLFGLEYGKEHAAHAAAPSPAEPVPPPAAEPRAAPFTASDATEPENSVVPEVPPRFASEAAAEPERMFDETAGQDAPAELPGEAGGDFAAATGGSATSPQDSYWDALANWNWDESEAGSKSRSEHRRTEGHRAESSRSEQARSEPGRSESSRPEQGRSGGGPPPRGGPRGRDGGRGRRGGDRPPRHGDSQEPAGGSSPPPPPRTSREAEPPAGDDFGLGVESAVPGFSAPATSPAEERQQGDVVGEGVPAPGTESQPTTAGSGQRHGDFRGERRGPGEEPATGSEGDFTRKRRRRRRRRRGGRGPEGETTDGGPAAAAVPRTDWDDASGPEVDVPQDVEPTAEAAGGTPSPNFEAEYPPRDARGRRHSRRRDEEHRSTAAERGRPSAEEDDELEGPQEIVVAGGGAGDEELESSPEGMDDDAGEEQIVSYDDVPTWEEAISYLLHPNQVQVEPASGGGGSNGPRGTPPADQPRQTRHIGHRKHRR